MPNKSGIEVSVFQPRSHVRLRKVRISHQNITFFSFFFFLCFFYIPGFFSSFLFFYVSFHHTVEHGNFYYFLFLSMSIYPPAFALICVIYFCLSIHLRYSVFSILVYLSTCVLCYPSMPIFPPVLFFVIHPCISIHFRYSVVSILVYLSIHLEEEGRRKRAEEE